MRLALQLFGLFAFTLSATAAATPELLRAGSGKQPNHLEPVSPRVYPFDKMLQKRLLPTGGGYGTFLFLPSFDAEMGVAIHDTYLRKDCPQTPGPIRITVMRASRNFYYAQSPSKDNHRKPVKVTRVEITIDRELAVAIQRAWATMILRTRYPAKAYHGDDGDTSQFSTFVVGLGEIYGKTWSPDAGLPKEFVALGFAVAEFASTSVADRPAKRAALIERLQAFERKARHS